MLTNRKGPWIWAALGSLVIIVVAACSSGEDEERPSASPTPTRVAEAASRTEAVEPAPLSPEALELRAWYQELLDFKDDPSFHAFCYAQGGPYADWVDRGEALEGRMDAKGIVLDVWAEAGVLRGEIWTMGAEYCANEGRETETTRFSKGNMEPRWLAASLGAAQGTTAAQQRPVAIIPTPSPTPQLPLELPLEVTSGMKALVACAGESEAYWLEHGPPKLTPALAQCLSEKMEAAP